MRTQYGAVQARGFAFYPVQPTGRPLRRGRAITLPQWERGVLFRHGRIVRVLEPGRHRRWAGGLTLRTVDLRPWVVLLPTQEVPSADGATLKVTVAGQAWIEDPIGYVTASRDPEQALYLAVQIALREVLSTTSVADLLAGRQGVGDRLREGVRGLGELGIVLEQLEVKDIVLSGELKKAQAEVLVARAQGLAALERARGETAALRSLANAARMATDNPAIIQLRLIQQLESSTGHTVVIGSPPLG
jgi:regulator of protease activity HflC (stomatin/prohibitin superfamily)